MLADGTAPAGSGDRPIPLPAGRPVLRRFLRISLMVCAALLLGGLGHAQEGEFDWDQEFPYPVYLVHISVTYTVNGPQERDAYILYPVGPEDGVLLTADGYGGHFINEAELVGGAYTTPRQVCNGVKGSPAKSFDMGHVPQLPWFSCEQQPGTDECTKQCQEYNNPHATGTIVDGKCSCNCASGYEPDANLMCVPTKARCDQDCLEYHGTSKLHGPEAFGKVENGICNCYCKEGYVPDDTLTCVKARSCTDLCQERLGAGGTGTGTYPDCTCSCEPPYQPQPVNGRCVKEGEGKKPDKPYCGDGVCDARQKAEDDRVFPENCERCEPDCSCQSRLDNTSCNPFHPEATVDNWGCVKVVAIIAGIGSSSGEMPQVFVIRSGSDKYTKASVGTPLNKGDRVELLGMSLAYPYVTIDWGSSQGRLILGPPAPLHWFYVGESALQTGWPTRADEFREGNQGVLWEIVSYVPKGVAGPVISFLGNPSSFPKDVIRVNVENTHILIEQRFEDLTVYALEGEAVVDNGEHRASATQGTKVSVVGGIPEEASAYNSKEIGERFPIELLAPGPPASSARGWVAILGIALVLLVAGGSIIGWLLVGRRRLQPAAAPVTGTGTSTAEWGPVSRPVEPAGGVWGTLSAVQGQAWPGILSLQQPVISIGRDPTSDLVVPDSRASRQHAQIRRVADGAVLYDLGSANGTFVNGVRITGPWPIQPGDVIHLGQTELVFETGPRAHEPARPRCRLVVTRGESVPPNLELRGKPLFHIGSGQGNDLVVHGDPFVSGQHAQIRQAEHGHEIVDLDSARGLFVNEELVARATLRQGDRIRMGSTEFLYQG